MGTSGFLVLPTASRSGRDYWEQTKQPLTSLVFCLPLLVTYELGLRLLAGQPSTVATLRNGADFWLRDLLHACGVDQPFLLPLLVVGVLLAWHLIGRFPWKVSLETLAGMLAESVMFAFFLLAVAQLEDLAFHWWQQQSAARGWAVLAFDFGASNFPVHPLWWKAAHIVTFLGAGIYEEVLFRLLLLPVCYFLFRLVLVPPKWAAGLAIVSTSLLFAAAHYVGPFGEPFLWPTFVFRTIAGLFFAVLFVLRGFGVTVGTHALYDVLVGVLLAGAH